MRSSAYCQLLYTTQGYTNARISSLSGEVVVSTSWRTQEPNAGMFGGASPTARKQPPPSPPSPLLSPSLLPNLESIRSSDFVKTAVPLCSPTLNPARLKLHNIIHRLRLFLPQTRLSRIHLRPGLGCSRDTVYLYRLMIRVPPPGSRVKSSLISLIWLCTWGTAGTRFVRQSDRLMVDSRLQ